METEPKPVVDAIVVQEEGFPFKSWATHESIERINQSGGFLYSNGIELIETEGRPIPHCVKEGQPIFDVLIEMIPRMEIFLN